MKSFIEFLARTSWSIKMTAPKLLNRAFAVPVLFVATAWLLCSCQPSAVLKVEDVLGSYKGSYMALEETIELAPACTYRHIVKQENRLVLDESGVFNIEGSSVYFKDITLFVGLGDTEKSRYTTNGYSCISAQMLFEPGSQEWKTKDRLFPHGDESSFFYTKE
jgi:hypothetical protein